MKKNLFSHIDTLKCNGHENSSASVERLLVFPLVGESLLPGNCLPLVCQSPKEFRHLNKPRKQLYVIMAHNSPKGEWACVGTRAEIAETLDLPGNQKGFLIRGIQRARVSSLIRRGESWLGRVEDISTPTAKRSRQSMAHMQSFRRQVVKFLKVCQSIDDDSRISLRKTLDPGALCDGVTAYLTLSSSERQSCLSTINLDKRVPLVAKFLMREIDLNEFSQGIDDQVQKNLSEAKRKEYLQEQIATFKNELDEIQGMKSDHDKLLERIDHTDWESSLKDRLGEELVRLELATPGSPDYLLAYTYLTFVTELPWKTALPAVPDLTKAEKDLDRNHFGLRDVKDRILEYLAVVQHSGKIPGQTILLNGPPGVGKTTLGKSIAKAMGRPFVKIALGGIKDEAEIRGHRRTYIGAMPGKILQAMKQSQSHYPVILLDEIDKTDAVLGGSVTSPLLEALDREQNHAFLDHYLALPFDLSQVVFLATSNSRNRIPPALADRLECLEIRSYTDEEKKEIAKQHIIPHLRAQMNLRHHQFNPSSLVIGKIIREYTQEPGVRSLQAMLASLGRKVVRSHIFDSQKKKLRLHASTLGMWLGPKKFIEEPKEQSLLPGVAIGLAYTMYGGEIMYIETSLLFGNRPNGVVVTGNVGKVLKESAQAVFTFLNANAIRLNLAPGLFTDCRIHIHLPNGGTPKDGPSAGLALLAAIVSLVTEKSLPSCVAMTGEITLRGQVLPVGGILEKLLGAYRYGKKRVIIPYASLSDCQKIPAEVLKAVQIVPVKTMYETLAALKILPLFEYRKQKAHVFH